MQDGVATEESSFLKKAAKVVAFVPLAAACAVGVTVATAAAGLVIAGTAMYRVNHGPDHTHRVEDRQFRNILIGGGVVLASPFIGLVGGPLLASQILYGGKPYDNLKTKMFGDKGKEKENSVSVHRGSSNDQATGANAFKALSGEQTVTSAQPKSVLSGQGSANTQSSAASLHDMASSDSSANTTLSAHTKGNEVGKDGSESKNENGQFKTTRNVSRN